MLPDIEFLRECIQKAFDDLKDAKASVHKGRPKAMASTAKTAGAPKDASIMYRRVSKTPRKSKADPKTGKAK